jgi:type IV pilus assembly protein PilW
MYDPKQRAAVRRAPNVRAAAGQRGVSIIELMVGIVVALFVSLAAAGSAMMFTASQRQGIGTGGTTVNVGTVLAALKNDTANAGLGFFGDNVFLCNTLNLSVDAAVISNGASFAPLRITQGAAGDRAATDRIDVVYSSQVHSGANVLLRAASDGSGAELMSLLPATVGQAVLLAPPEPPAAAVTCMVRTVTAVTPSTDETPQLLAFAPAASHNAAAFAPVAYPERSRVALLGELRWHRYRVNGTDLVLERPMDNRSAILARNVIGFRAQYGINDGTVLPSGAPSPTIDSWQDADAAPFAVLDSAAIGRVRALRIGIVTRSPQREKPDGAGNCVASDAKPVLFGDVVEPDVGADWGCFRYRTTTTVLPLRNLVMGMK